MTQKELLYVEDAVNHEIFMLQTINEVMDCLTDEKLIKFIKKFEKKHEEILEIFMNLLEECN